MTGWTMKQIFSGKVPQTNEEFVQYLKKREHCRRLTYWSGIAKVNTGRIAIN